MLKVFSATILWGILAANTASGAPLPCVMSCQPGTECSLDIATEKGEVSYVVKVKRIPVQPVAWHAALIFPAESAFQQGMMYRISFDAKSSNHANFTFSAKQKEMPWDYVGDQGTRSKDFRVGPQWTNFQHTFVAARNFSAKHVELYFFAGNNPPGTVLRFRNVKLEELSAYDLLSLNSVVNWGFADEIAADGKGGWSDQGPSNDFSSFPLGIRRYCQIPFRVIDPATNGGKAILSFETTAVRSGLKEATVPFPSQRKYLYLLHAETFAPSTSVEIGKIIFNMQDGTKRTQDIRHAVDCGDWWSPREYKNAAIAFEQQNDLVRIGAYVSKFDVPEGTVSATIQTTGISNWIIIGATLADFDMSREALTLLEFQENAEWRPMPMAPYVNPDSALDLSGNDFPPGNPQRIIVSNGHLAFADSPETPLRLRGSVYLLHRLYDYPARMFQDPQGYKAALEKFADALKRGGYNMIRLHLLDGSLMKWELNSNISLPDATSAIPFDPRKMDFYHYLIKCCRDRGIYITLDLGGTNTMYSNSRPSWSGNDLPKDAKSRLYYDDAYRKNWAAGVTWLIQAVNPYTGLRLAEDNTVFLVEFCNEQFLDWSKTTIVALDPEWQKFMQTRTNTPASFPPLDHFIARGGTDLGAAMNLFVMNKEMELLKFYEKTVRDAGYQGLCFNFDNAHQISRIPVLAQLQVNSLHPYFSHTEHVGQKELVGQNTHATIGAAFMAAWRLIDRPFVTTEYNYAFWNQYRHESGLLQPVVAALNEWDGVTTHCEALFPVELPLRTFFNGSDPINRAYEVLCHYIWRRKFLSPNPGKSAFLVTDEDLEKHGAKIVNYQTGALLGWLTRTGISYTGAKQNGNAMASADMYFNPFTGTLRGKDGRDRRKIVDSAELLQLLKDKHLLPTSNRSNPQNAFWQSGSGEVFIDARNNEISIIAPSLEAITVKRPQNHILNTMTVKKASIPALISVIAQDNAEIRNSSKLLLIIASDAVNSGMKFSSSKRLELEEYGKLPVLYRCGEYALTLKNNMVSPKLYALRSDGSRIEEIPVTCKDGEINISIDVTKLSEPALFFELCK